MEEEEPWIRQGIQGRWGEYDKNALYEILKEYNSVLKIIRWPWWLVTLIPATLEVETRDLQDKDIKINLGNLGKPHLQQNLKKSKDR